MKKILVLSLVLLFAAGAMAQDLFLYYGWPGTGTGSDPTDPIFIGPNKNVEIPVFFMCGEPEMVVGNYNAPIGINNEFADDILEGSCFYPISSINQPPGPPLWDVLSFENAREDVAEVQTFYGTTSTWDTYTALGFKDVVAPFNNPPFTNEVAENLLTFVIHTNDDPTLLDQTSCLVQNAGYDPFAGWPNASDTTGGINYNVIWDAACYYFSPNQGVEIRPLFDADDYCTYEDFQLLFDVFDPDGDDVEAMVSVGTLEALGSDPEGDGTVWHFAINFDAEELCGQCVSGDIVIDAVDGTFASPINDPVSVTQGTMVFIGQMTATIGEEDCTFIWPGESDWMNFYLDACGDCFCLGGFVFTVAYDPALLDMGAVERGAILMGGTYWNVNEGVAGPGTVRFTFINDLGPDSTQGEPICAIPDDSYLFRMHFSLDPDYNYPADMELPIYFVDEGYNFNNVTDDEGYAVWFPDGCVDDPDSSYYGTLDLALEPGCIKVASIHNIVMGDINANGFPFEAGDVVLLANHLMDPVAYPFTNRQLHASDVNGDGIMPSVADLIYMINVLNGYDGFGKLAPLAVEATVSMPANASGDVDVTINSEAAVGGAVIEIAHAGVELGVPTADVNIEYSDNGEVMTVVVYSDEPMTNNVEGFTLPILGEGNVSINNVQVSDNRGALLDSRSEVAAAIPEVFSVNQNFPNPFNAKTSIAYGLPTDADVNISIYNVAGQLVESMDLGHVQAGTHSVVWDASDVASGVYFYKVDAGSFTETMKMTLLK